ncbi:ABC transporter [Bacillus sp. FJAT-27225]|uniref:ABC transporter permease n=1 Tax=Bacillus sp. FJAT-27225 TaxID=1743144 RepID=UPI00080C27A5|nr:ABC transporter permease [Bacillus sp. FJAT-27225]OCA85706.1 ABC transporter [Bacillus sp. FJAT-27225]
MRRVWAIAFLHVKEMFRTPSAWVVMFVMPLLFSLIFGGMASNSDRSKPVVAVAGGGAPLTGQAVKLLTGNDQYKWKQVSEKDAMSLVKEQEAIAAILIPDGIEERIGGTEPLFEIIVQRETREYTGLYPYLEGTARTLASTGSMAASISEEAWPVLLNEVAGQEAMKIEKEIIQKEGKFSADISLLSIGFTLMFMMFGISSAASAILEERAGGTWPRLMTTPATRGQVVAGYVMSYFLMGWIQLSVLMSAISLIYGGKWGNLVWFILYASLVILTIVGFGLMIAGIVKTKQQAGAVSAVLIVSTSMLGGLYWPLEIVPDIMKLIAKFVPQSWMMSGIREIVGGSLHAGTIWTSVAALVGFSILFYTLGLRKIRY